MLFIRMDIGYDKVLLVSNYVEETEIAESLVGSILDTNVEFVESNSGDSEVNLLNSRIVKELKRQGWTFENPEKYYKRCALCGRKYTYLEATTKDRLCCSNGNYIIPEWKSAENYTLRNVRIFKIKEGPTQ